MHFANMKTQVERNGDDRRVSSGGASWNQSAGEVYTCMHTYDISTYTYVVRFRDHACMHAENVVCFRH